MASAPTSKEPQLVGRVKLGSARGSVQLLIHQALSFVLPLLAHVVDNCVLVTLRPNGRHEVAVRPELATPQLLLHVRTPLEHLARDQTLDQRDDSRWAVGRNRLHKEMHMIRIGADLDKLDLVAARNLQTPLAQNTIYALLKPHTAILGGKHRVIQQNAHVVTFVDQTVHPKSQTHPSFSKPIHAASGGVSTQKRMNL